MSRRRVTACGAVRASEGRVGVVLDGPGRDESALRNSKDMLYDV
jgi:hypothetical protein